MKSQFAHFTPAPPAAPGSPRAHGAPRPRGLKAPSSGARSATTTTSKPLCLCTLRRKGGF